MPLVISHKSKRTYYVRDEEVLGEILGHSNFDDEDWAIGDVIVFEDGTVAQIEQHLSGPFHEWSEPKTGTLEAVLSQIRAYGDDRLPRQAEVVSWERLFEHLSVLPPRAGWRQKFVR